MDSNGMVQVPLKESGFGVKVDIDYIDALTVRTEKIKLD